MKNVELVATYWTLAGATHPHPETEYSSFDFEDRVVAAAKAGFKGFVNCMLKAGYAGPWGIEVLSEDLRKKPLEYAATHAFETTIAQFEFR